jgi:hypothetical protein
LDGLSLTPPLSTFVYAEVGQTYLFSPGTIVGYATGVSAGTHTLTVYASSQPATTSPGFLITGNASSYLMEVEEIP